jgi:uncharacterized protein YjiS (DUF1127 family)
MSTQSHMERDVSARLVGANGAAFGIVTDLISRAGRMLAQHLLERAYRRAEKKLMVLDDRMLEDFGHTRCEAASAVRNYGYERTSSLLRQPSVRRHHDPFPSITPSITLGRQAPSASVGVGGENCRF